MVPILRLALMLVALVAVGAAVAGGSPQGDRRVTNTFGLVTVQAASPQAPLIVRSNGTGIAPSKPVVSNPYQVPLLQNAGSIRSLR